MRRKEYVPLKMKRTGTKTNLTRQEKTARIIALAEKMGVKLDESASGDAEHRQDSNKDRD